MLKDSLSKKSQSRMPCNLLFEHEATVLVNKFKIGFSGFEVLESCEETTTCKGVEKLCYFICYLMRQTFNTSIKFSSAAKILSFSMKKL